MKDAPNFWIVGTHLVGEDMPCTATYAVAAHNALDAARAVRQLNHDARIDEVELITYPRAWRVTFER